MGTSNVDLSDYMVLKDGTFNAIEINFEQVCQLKRIADSLQELVRLARTTGVKTK